MREFSLQEEMKKVEKSKRERRDAIRYLNNSTSQAEFLVFSALLSSLRFFLSFSLLSLNIKNKNNLSASSSLLFKQTLGCLYYMEGKKWNNK